MVSQKLWLYTIISSSRLLLMPKMIDCHIAGISIMFDNHIVKYIPGMVFRKKCAQVLIKAAQPAVAPRPRATWLPPHRRAPRRCRAPRGRVAGLAPGLGVGPRGSKAAFWGGKSGKTGKKPWFSPYFGGENQQTATLTPWSFCKCFLKQRTLMNMRKELIWFHDGLVWNTLTCVFYLAK